ncbi:endo alpha-1,4 polygalactosaminidase [Streptomyces sp. NPDC102365]|uniref:endo alpha-1,4 polygalactosaminidase n=1 Tax=Streptomyces sp. NPDC102365 TaxID=3366162 RepID=UPI003811C64D
MPAKRGPRARLLGAAAALVALAALVSCTSDGGGKDPAGSRDGTGSTKPRSEAVRLPPVPDGFDYQIGGAYTPPSGVRIVARDRGDDPARGLYNICYVNAFQAQPDEQDDWPDDLLLRDGKDEVVIDADWDEALLDIGTPAKRERVADRVDQWIDGCADKGFDAVEPDNYDSYTRSDGLLNADDAVSFIKLLSQRAHARGLAIAQKNTVELADRRTRAGLDFAVVEECGAYDECGAYADAFDDRVVVVEYTDKGFEKALDGFGDRLSVVRRDVQVSTPDSDDYVRETG